MPSLVWFRDDLRIADNPALTEGMRDPTGTVAVFVHDEETPGVRPLGSATKWWLYHSLLVLEERLTDIGVPLVMMRGPTREVIEQVASHGSLHRVLWNRRYGPERHADAALKTSLNAQGISAESFPGNLLFEPWTVLTQQHTPYRVFSAWWRAAGRRPAPSRPLPPPTPLHTQVAPSQWRLPTGHSIESLDLLPKHSDWATKFHDTWTPGEPHAHTRLAAFLGGPLAQYATHRDIPSHDATSSLSPHLRFGEISPRTVWHAVEPSAEGAAKFRSELGWRDFAWYTLFYNPNLHTEHLDQRFDTFPWRTPNHEEWEAWTRGTTGFPLVDAGMRELWHTGTMHNRVRMVVASFLTKNLLTHWRAGEEWFWDTLVDADPASNPFNWQWVAGSGVDAAPFFRIFNPETQYRTFDPHGIYSSEWAPESLTIPPIVDLHASRQRALDAFHHMKSQHAAGDKTREA